MKIVPPLATRIFKMHPLPLPFLDPWGAYHLTENFGNSGWKVLNGKVTFRKFQPKIEEYVLR